MAEFGNFTINITCPDEEHIKKFGETIEKMVEEKYKGMMEEQNLKLEAQSPDEMFTKFKSLISESKLGGSVTTCGMGLGIQQPFTIQNGQVFIRDAKVVDQTDKQHKPFVVVDGQVYINQAFIKEGTIQFKEKQ